MVKLVMRVLVFALALVTVVVEQGAATQHAVGGSRGWEEGTDLDSWSKGQSFKVGDTLVFKYTPGLHSVVELGSESAYKTCDVTTDAVNTLKGGNDIVKLDKPGARYFACGTPGHCSQGMKLKVTVAAAAGNSSPSFPAGSDSSSSSSSSGARCIYSFCSFCMVVAAIFSFFVV